MAGYCGGKPPSPCHAPYPAACFMTTEGTWFLTGPLEMWERRRPLSRRPGITDLVRQRPVGVPHLYRNCLSGGDILVHLLTGQRCGRVLIVVKRLLLRTILEDDRP